MVRSELYCTPSAQKIVTLCPPAEQKIRFRDFLVDQVGKPYDWLAILSFAVRFRMRLRNHWFCSELVQSALEGAGIFPHIEADLISPGTLDWFLDIYDKIME